MNGNGFWNSLHRHFLLLLVMGPLGIQSGGGKGNCSHLRDVTLKFICHSVVPPHIYAIYRDSRAPINTPYSVWQTEATDKVEDMIVLVTFHDNYMHRFEAMRVAHYDPADTQHTFSMQTTRGFKPLIISPSLLYCFHVGLRYPMELRSSCLGSGRSTEVASKPVLHYAMHDVRTPSRLSNIANTLNPSGIVMIIVPTWLLVVVGL
ncbi:uncharacterized protein LOC110180336 [Drosophila serrata]|uniref:uncharacterized protein LOC110180336 n=1 Tax=Drosophila serrata TaxID=7274 RepID=UPI000A1D19B2|nr:uncharacterized protein LOC110180336 [Drosophila serrata]